MRLAQRQLEWLLRTRDVAGCAVIGFLRTHQSHLIKGIPPTSLQIMVRACVSSACERHDLYMPDDLLAYAALTFEFFPGFDDHPSIREWLLMRDRRLDPCFEQLISELQEEVWAEFDMPEGGWSNIASRAASEQMEANKLLYAAASCSQPAARAKRRVYQTKKAARRALLQECQLGEETFFELALPVIQADGFGSIGYPPPDGLLTLSSRGGYESCIDVSSGVTTSDQYCSFRFYDIEESHQSDLFTATLTWLGGTQILFEEKRVFSYVEEARHADNHIALYGEPPRDDEDSDECVIT
ncbi:hypothetical protein [Polyangium sp. y55x31]|uniref:hypothetical protein n=1 Tax=Polyangium sp. y55x31 TaxID=3042688 RepID=UPI002482CCAF|nr:hypothetical protein [Polyangium sp. y55x31]MDI1476394.1 hypothetical protein [Polyangium sp. y55x31]